MCKPQSQGGQRCAAHTRPAYRQAMADALTISPAELGARLDADIESVIAFAATPTGEQEIFQDLQHLENAYQTAWANEPSNGAAFSAGSANLAALRHAISQGRSRREAAKMTASILRHEAAARKATTDSARQRQPHPSPAFTKGHRVVRVSDGAVGTVTNDDIGMASSTGRLQVRWDNPTATDTASGIEWVNPGDINAAPSPAGYDDDDDADDY